MSVKEELKKVLIGQMTRHCNDDVHIDWQK